MWFLKSETRYYLHRQLLFFSISFLPTKISPSDFFLTVLSEVVHFILKLLMFTCYFLLTWHDLTKWPLNLACIAEWLESGPGSGSASNMVIRGNSSHLNVLPCKSDHLKESVCICFKCNELKDIGNHGIPYFPYYLGITMTSW